MPTHRKGPAEQRFGKVWCELFDDPRVQALPERAQLLYFRLITGPETLRVPGLVRVRRGALMDRYGWSQAEFDGYFQAIEAAKLATADWERGIVLLQDQLRYEFNKPTSLNMVVCWRRELVAVRDCDLVEWVFARLRSMLAQEENPKWLDALEGRYHPPGPGQASTAKKGKKASSRSSKLPSDTPDPDPDPRSSKEDRGPPPSSFDPEDPEIEDLTRFAKRLPEERPGKAKEPPPAPPPRVEEQLGLQLPYDPEHLAHVLWKASGGWFKYGLLDLDGSVNPLGGRLHPSVRRDWVRTLKEVFGKLRKSHEEVAATLSKVGALLQQREREVTIPQLCKFDGEQLQDLIARTQPAGRPAPPVFRPAPTQPRSLVEPLLAAPAGRLREVPPPPPDAGPWAHDFYRQMQARAAREANS